MSYWKLTPGMRADFGTVVRMEDYPWPADKHPELQLRELLYPGSAPVSAWPRITVLVPYDAPMYWTDSPCVMMSDAGRKVLEAFAEPGDMEFLPVTARSEDGREWTMWQHHFLVRADVWDREMSKSGPKGDIIVGVLNRERLPRQKVFAPWSRFASSIVVHHTVLNALREAMPRGYWSADKVLWGYPDVRTAN